MASSLSPSRATLKAPLSVCLWIADACNLACRYCYAAPFSGRFMDTVRLLELVDELLELQVFGIVLAGGEPFLHPAIFDVIRKCTDRGVQLGVLSNGVYLDAPRRQKLVEIVTGKRFILQISLDSADPALNDHSRGCGATVLENLHCLCSTGIQLQLACVLTRQNISSAHLLIPAFYPRIKRFHFLNVQRTSQALSHDDVLLAEGQAKEFWLHLNEYAKQYPPDLFLPSLRIMMRGFGIENSREEHQLNRSATFSCVSCAAGLTHVNVDANFNVLGCDIAKDFTSMGNVRDVTFESVWHSQRAQEVRDAPFPACYRNQDPDGVSLEMFLRDEYVCARALVSD